MAPEAFVRKLEFKEEEDIRSASRDTGAFTLLSGTFGGKRSPRVCPREPTRGELFWLGLAGMYWYESRARTNLGGPDSVPAGCAV